MSEDESKTLDALERIVAKLIVGRRILFWDGNFGNVGIVFKVDRDILHVDCGDESRTCFLYNIRELEAPQ